MTVRALLILILQAVAAATQAPQEHVMPLAAQEWGPLGLITGFHRITHKKLGFEVRVLEADGSESVAHNPVSLFVVVTNRGTSDLKEQIWRLPVTVAAVRKIVPTHCGVDIMVMEDAIRDTLVVGEKPAVIRTCFVDLKGDLRPDLELREVPGTK